MSQTQVLKIGEVFDNEAVKIEVRKTELGVTITSNYCHTDGSGMSWIVPLFTIRPDGGIVQHRSHGTFYERDAEGYIPIVKGDDPYPMLLAWDANKHIWVFTKDTTVGR